MKKITTRDVESFLNRAKAHIAASSARAYSEIIEYGVVWAVFDDEFILQKSDNGEVSEKVVKNWRKKSPTMILMELNRKDFTVNHVISEMTQGGFGIDSETKL